jgi:hypothetical protein
LKRGLLTPKRAPKNKQNPKKTENEKERIKRGGGGCQGFFSIF